MKFKNLSYPDSRFCFRLVLRCRQEARARFARLRSDVLVKLELLDNKHVQDIVIQLQRLVSNLAEFHSKTLALLKENNLFPVEDDLSRNAFQYESTNPVISVVSIHYLALKRNYTNFSSKLISN